MHNDGVDHAKICDFCQWMGNPSRWDEMLLVLEVTPQPFDKWEVDFVGPINTREKRTGARYIIRAIDYLTIWAEATLVTNCTAVTTTRFSFDNFVTRFGCPNILMSDKGSHFINRIISAMMEEFKI